MARHPIQRHLIAQIGAHAMHASHAPGETTAKARRIFRNSFEQLVDPDGVLPPDERARRAEHARSEHYARLSLARWHKDREKKAAQNKVAS